MISGNLRSLRFNVLFDKVSLLTPSRDGCDNEVQSAWYAACHLGGPQQVTADIICLLLLPPLLLLSFLLLLLLFLYLLLWDSSTSSELWLPYMFLSLRFAVSLAKTQQRNINNPILSWFPPSVPSFSHFTLAEPPLCDSVLRTRPWQQVSKGHKTSLSCYWEPSQGYHCPSGVVSRGNTLVLVGGSRSGTNFCSHKSHPFPSIYFYKDNGAKIPLKCWHCQILKKPCLEQGA